MLRQQDSLWSAIVDVKLMKWPQVEVGNGSDRWSTGQTSVLFEVRDGTTLVGRFQVSTGGIRWWRGAAQQATKFATWDDLVEWLGSS